MTHHSEKLIPLDWNQFPLDYTWKDVVVKFDFTVSAQSLSLTLIPEDRNPRHDLIMRFHSEGFSDRQILEHLNDCTTLNPNGLKYYSKLIWVTRKKPKDKDKRR